MKVLQINTTFINGGSIGRIAYDLTCSILDHGYEPYVAYSCLSSKGDRFTYRMDNLLSRKINILRTRLFGRHGFYNKNSTDRLINWIKAVNPDIIHLHNLHNHYINVEVLFNYLKQYGKPIVWTLHDCWAFTGGCAYFDFHKCFKWQKGCHHCPALDEYPKTWIFDRSKQLFLDKRRLFTEIPRMTLITPSRWLESIVRQSFLSNYSVQTIYNGINTNIFTPRGSDFRSIYRINDKKLVLAVANVFSRRKGSEFLVKLSHSLSKDIQLVLVGVDQHLRSKLLNSTIALGCTDSLERLAEIYTAADVFINPTLEDNFPTTNLEALACGTPVITYKTGGSPEAIDDSTGIVIEKNDETSFIKSINDFPLKSANERMVMRCRDRANTLFKKSVFCEKYIQLYQKISSS